MVDPRRINKYLYIEKTPTWLVRGVYFYGILSWLLVSYGFLRAMGIDGFYRWFVAPIIILLTIYHVASFGLNLFYQQFDLKKHLELVKRSWRKNGEPSFDVYLPICGEDTEVLKNTWHYVSLLKYKNKKVYVLDDSKEGCVERKLLAEEFGFSYFERPNKGEMKKAGNLKYAFERTNSKFIVIFDADFAPHEDFLKELLPYMSNPKVGIVQTPQYFETTKKVHDRSPLEYGAAYAEEPFYRFIQVVRDRFRATICCGSNAIYRRAALESIGGPVQMEHSEDAHTGFALSHLGWRVQYVPVILAVGLCPGHVHAYFHQQHRWGMGSMSLLLSKKFWQSKVSWKARFCHISGFMFYLHHPIVIIFSFQLFWALILYSPYISLSNGGWFYPHLAFAVVCLFVLPLPRFRWGYLYALLLQTYSYSHAIFSAFLSKSVGWIPTNTKQATESAAFRQTTLVVAVYVFLYISLIALAVRGQVLHLYNYNYYSVQFWLFYNLGLSCLLLWQMYKTMQEMRFRLMVEGVMSKVALGRWVLKTAGLYISSLSLMFWFLAYW